ncbi:RDD family protein [Aureitalea marina]|uniref:Transporter n=1 Tax=Aureitalea marina TaxID=930804 RepID=A0A2S7KPW7_9FLAO|nr:RDD family protein [Aureitalea marina]PQB04647.1 transporter [Aureitalea marina]
MDNFQIETAQNVRIEQDAAGVGERILAFLIDSLIIAAYSIATLYILGSIDLPDDMVWVFILSIGLPILLYHLLWESLWNGRSPGKAAMQLRVVKLDGSRPAFSNFLLRWLLRFIDVSISSGAVALVTILMNGRGQRLGDIAATTTVISEKQTGNLGRTLLMDLPEDYQPKYPQVTVFTDREIQTIKNVLNDSRANRNYNIIHQLSERVATVMEITPQEKAVDFLTTVIKDYNYYTQ